MSRPAWRCTLEPHIAVPLVWVVATIGAFIVALQAVENDASVDGLTYFYQLPLALPWAFLPVGTLSPSLHAWIFFGMGLLNAILIHLWLRRRRRAGRPLTWKHIWNGQFR